MSIFQAILIAIVEGITEFLPISSTGHMIIATKILGIEPSEFLNAFIVNIQFGAILSVIVLYWKRFFQTFNFYVTLFVAFIPAAVFGFLFSDAIDRMLENVLVVAVSLFVGGIILLFVDKWFEKTDKQQEIGLKKALFIGFFQVIAMIPGVSRSAATIIGGMSQKLTRKNAAEFSFFLAVPTMFAASAYKLLKGYQVFTSNHIHLLVIGNVVAFIVALLAIKLFIGFLSKNGFKSFGYYRIIVGLILIILILSGVNLSVV